MRKTFTKGILALVVVAMVALMASPATAFILNARSEEMIARSSCDRAGSIEMRFGQDDVLTIASYLYGALIPGSVYPTASNFVLLRSTLGGTNVDLDADVPLLCRDIAGDTSATGSPVVNLPLPNSGNLVPLDFINIEVSDVAGAAAAGPDGIPDFRAYVYGRTGSQFFTIYIADLQFGLFDLDFSDTNNWPWLNVGLFDELQTDEDTAICADVHDFGPLATLNVSLNNVPETLEYTTSDDQIGHFLPSSIELEECKKDESCPGIEPNNIPLCEVAEQADCPTFSQCIAVDGNFPAQEDLQLVIRTNGATNGADTQSGIYISSVSVRYIDDLGLTRILPTAFSYYEADGTTLVNSLNCTFLAEQARSAVDAADFEFTRVFICIQYQVDVEEAVRHLDENVQFWVDLATVPCGNLVNDVVEGPVIVKCTGGDDCMYFPYVLINYSPWTTGIGVSNLSPDVDVADMEVTARLEINEGTVYTGVIDASSGLITGKVFAFTLDDIAAAVGAEVPPQSRGWLWLKGNFIIDGFNFTFNAGDDFNFGSATLPRLLDTCDYPFNKND